MSPDEIVVTAVGALLIAAIAWFFRGPRREGTPAAELPEGPVVPTELPAREPGEYGLEHGMGEAARTPRGPPRRRSTGGPAGGSFRPGPRTGRRGGAA